MSPETRDLAKRLVAHDAALEHTLKDESFTCHVYEKLRSSLETFLGPEGYSSLASLALDMAKLEAPILDSVRVRENGSIDGLIGEAINANSILVAQLIGLMETFIGETVTLWLLHDIWPEFFSPMRASDGNTLNSADP